MGLAFATDRLLELYMWNGRPFMSASDFEMVRYATQLISKALAEAPHLQIIATYWVTAMHQNTVWSIPFGACTMQILKTVCWIDGSPWSIHTQTDTRLTHKLIWLHSISFTQEAITLKSCMISTTLNPLQSVWNSLIPCWETKIIFSKYQSMRKVVNVVHIQPWESRTLIPNR